MLYLLGQKIVNMCGILAVLQNAQKPVLKPLVRRGPDETGMYKDENISMGHTRLSIVQPESGPQPIRYKGWVMVINGELYNARVRKGETDCHMLMKLIQKYGTKALQRVDGVFAFVAYHKKSQKVIVARDPIGVMPLYWSNNVFASLLTCIRSGDAQQVPPGHVAEFTIGETPVFEKWTPDYLRAEPTIHLRTAMEKAVSKRLMGNVPWGVLLSGGLDSTIVAALAVHLAKKKRPDYPVVHSFCIGLKDSPDVVTAEKVARDLGTHHTSITYTIGEGIRAIPKVIRAVETYDVTTVRASVPMWLLAKAIRKRGIKMVLSGEGSDELFAGYLYNLHCPSEEAMEEECKRKMNQLYAYDCQRANKTMGDFGIETRVPFLDKQVVDFAMNQLPTVDKMSGTHPNGPKIEKWWLREQFKKDIPAYVLERTKAQFSDAVGSAWIDSCKSYSEKKVSDADFAKAKKTFPFQTPDTKEAYLYRSIFRKCFGKVSKADETVLFQSSIACSTDVAAKWHAAFKNCLDPSGDAIQKAFDVS
jgi:asparagine synthase (glutamine-hydrolysing)